MLHQHHTERTWSLGIQDVTWTIIGQIIEVKQGDHARRTPGEVEYRTVLLYVDFYSGAYHGQIWCLM